MPDQNNPTDTNFNPSRVNPPSEPTQMPAATPPVPDVPTGDVSIPPPFPPETSPIEGAPPPFDIPPVIVPAGKPKGFGGKKVIATILGLLVLVGGLGAGIILVRQQQDIREKAVTTDPYATCTRIPTSAITRETGDSLTITQADLNKCKQYCPDGQLFAARYKCDGINLSAGCQDNGVSLDASVGKSYPVGNLTCGTVQIDVGCKNASGTWGSVKFLSKSAATACAPPPPPPGTTPPTAPPPPPTPTPPGSTPTPPPTAQCLNIQAFDTSWNKLSSTDLSNLKPGDKVRFTVAGQASSGKFDKARFKVNGVQRPEVTGKRPGTEEYFDEYTIPEGITTFSIGAQIHHETLGWSN